MSLHFDNVSLAGCAPDQRWQAELRNFQTVLDYFSGGDQFLGEMFRAVEAQSFWLHGSDNQDYAQVLKTDDGRGWFAARMFVARHGAFVVLLPWCGDREQKDGTRSDRLAQIHRFGHVETSEIQKVLESLTTWLSVRKPEEKQPYIA